MKPKKQKKYIAPSPNGEMAALLALRILALPGIVQELSKPGQYFPLIMELLGANPEDEKLSAIPNIQERIQKNLADAEKKSPPSGALYANLKTLGDKLGLDKIDQDILAFKVLIDQNMLLDDFSALEMRRTYQTARVIGAAIGASAEKVHRELSPTGMLRRLRIIELNPFYPSLSSKIQLHQGVSDALLTEWDSPEEIIRLWAYPSPESRLAPDDFPHLDEEIRVLKNIIQTASQTRRRGINFLIHGKPGNGKTDLSRLIAGMAGTQTYEVPLESKDGKSLEAHARLDAFNTAQYLLASKGECAIIYDEVEDAFTGRKKLLSEDNNHENQDRKAWINRLLEENPVPAIWIANQISHLDPAYLRRFTYILEVQTPPRSVRARLLNEKLGALGARKAWTDKMAEDARLTPAIINQMALLASSTAMTNAESVEALCEKSWQHRLSAAREPFTLRTGSATSYHLEFTNTAPGIEGIEDALARTGKGKLLLYGPPGTGKTELAHHVSRHLNRPLMSKRASDIMSSWVGRPRKTWPGCSGKRQPTGPCCYWMRLTASCRIAGKPCATGR